MNTEMGSGGLTERIASEINHGHGSGEQTLELIEFLYHRAGTSLAWVAAYDDDGQETLYLQPAASSASDTDIADIVSHLRFESPHTEEFSSPYDALRATVRLFEGAVVLHLPRGDACGVAVGFEPDVARILSSFIDDCELYL